MKFFVCIKIVSEMTIVTSNHNSGYDAEMSQKRRKGENKFIRKGIKVKNQSEILKKKKRKKSQGTTLSAENPFY